MKTITFYSYKGGVGRSLALSNIAIRLAEFNKRVCVLDFDLEAPGLQFKFKNFTNLHKVKIEKGIVDYIFSFNSDRDYNSKIKNFTYNLTPKNSRFKPIHLIPAGNVDSKEYWFKLNSINWREMFYSEGATGIEFFLDLKSKINNEIKPDYLLIDSRTGITDVSGVSLRILADEVVVLCANNEENLYGSKKVIKTLLNPDTSFFNKKTKVHFVMTRLPFTENDGAKESQIIANVRRELNREIPNNNIDLLVIHSDRRLEEKEIPLIGYEIEGKGVSISDDYLKLFDKLTEGDLTTDEKEHFKNVRISEREFQKAKLEENPVKKLEHLNSAINYDSTNWTLYWERGWHLLREKMYDELMHDIKKLRELENELPALILEGKLQLFYKNFEEAEALFSKAILLNPYSSFLCNHKALALKYLNKLNEAESIISHSLQNLDPDDVESLNTRADLYRIMGKIPEAFQDIRRAIELQPNEPVLYGTLAEIYSADGNNAEFYLHLVIALSKKLTAEHMKTAKEVYSKYQYDEKFNMILLDFGIDSYELFSND